MPLQGRVAAVAIEATTGWRWVWRELSLLGFDVRLADPSEVKALRGTSKRPKTDRLDARWLVVLLARELLPESWLPSAEIQELRDKTRLRKAIAEDRTRWAQRLQAFLLHEGWPCGRGRLLTAEGRRWAAALARSRQLGQLRDLLVTTPEPLRSELRPLTRARLLRRLAASRPETRRDPELRGSMLALRSIARRVLQLQAEERELAREIEALTRKLAPQLLDQPGVGPHAAAQLVLSWSHRGRIRSEAAFARLAGAAPIPASSGQTIRYRLDRSGDRKLNRALHMILVTRKRTHPATIAYIERRIQEGKTRREANRCLKRYLARNLYRLLEHGPPTTA